MTRPLINSVFTDKTPGFISSDWLRQLHTSCLWFKYDEYKRGFACILRRLRVPGFEHQCARKDNKASRLYDNRSTFLP